MRRRKRDPTLPSTVWAEQEDRAYMPEMCPHL